MTGRRIDGYDLALPVDWVPVPRDGTDPAVWAQEEAARLLAQSAGDELANAFLAEQLLAVAVSARDGAPGTRAAALVRDPSSGLVDAMIAVTLHGGAVRITPQSFARALQEEVDGATPSPVHVQALRGTADAGDVRGVHLMMGHLDPDDDAVAHLEEWVVLGVFPPRTGQMIQVTAIAASVGTFENMPAEVHSLLAGLSVRTEGVA